MYAAESQAHILSAVPPPKFSVNNKQISISFTHYMLNYISLHCVWLLQSCHRMREQQLESHIRKISYGSLSINALLPKTWFYKVEKALNSTWLSRQCPTFAKKGFIMSQQCLKLHALWCTGEHEGKVLGSSHSTATWTCLGIPTMYLLQQCHSM